MKILLVGSGGREHALAWRLAHSKECSALYCAPGNAGISECADLVPIAVDDIEGLVTFARRTGVELVIIGPEVPLVAGLVDRLAEINIKAFGPTAAAARLEGSKAFMKELCTKYNVPTAAYGHFTDIGEAKAFIEAQKTPLVVKADGLAAGKGVIIAQSKDEAARAAEEMLSGQAFGVAGQEIIIEEFLQGEEISFFAIADGQDFICLTSARDYKRVGAGDTGPNTGGMGALSPAPNMNKALGKKIEETIIRPVIDGMAKEGCPFSGILFAGLMLVEGEPILLEFNTRFGDPECQTLMMRLESDLLPILAACAEGRLSDVKGDICWSDEAAVCLVMATEGYPGDYPKGTVIRNIHEADRQPDTKIFHAGTAFGAAGEILSDGGRVLGITAKGATIADARQNVYAAAEKIDWPEGFYRPDIGKGL